MFPVQGTSPSVHKPHPALTPSLCKGLPSLFRGALLAQAHSLQLLCLSPTPIESWLTPTSPWRLPNHLYSSCSLPLWSILILVVQSLAGPSMVKASSVSTTGELVRSSESPASPQTCPIRFYILIRYTCTLASEKLWTKSHFFFLYILK